METNLKKFIPILSALCLCFTSVHAASYDADEHDKGQTKHAVPPGQHPGGEDGPNIFVSADYTYWKPYQGGMVIAASNYYSTATSAPVLGKSYSPDTKGRSGFKVGVGANAHHDGWDAQAQYTWFYNKKNKMKNAGFTALQALGTWKIDPTADVVALNSASSKWDSQFNRIDVELARSFYAGHYLAYRPMIGLVGAWEDQTFDFDYKVGSTTTAFRNTQKFWGIGPYGGSDASFYFTNEWALFMNAGMGLPLSKFDAKEQQQNGSTGKTTTWNQNTVWSVAPVLDMALGVRWDTWWSDNSMCLRLQAGWEQQVWFDHNHIREVGGDFGNYANYSMQGLTIKARANF